MDLDFFRSLKESIKDKKITMDIRLVNGESFEVSDFDLLGSMPPSISCTSPSGLLAVAIPNILYVHIRDRNRDPIGFVKKS